MSQTRFPYAPLAILIIVGMLILGGFAIYRISWLDGYKTGQLVAHGAEGTVVPYLPYRGPGCGGLLLTLGLIFLFILVIGKFARFWAWRSGWGPKSERWVRRWHGHGPHGPVPPWWWGWEEPSEEKADEPKPDTNAGDVEAKAEA
jgi:hypothetical protein